MKWILVLLSLVFGLPTCAQDATQSTDPHSLDRIRAEMRSLVDSKINVVDLRELTTLPPEVAGIVGGIKVSPDDLKLLLDGLTSLDAKTAESLSRFTGRLLSLNGLKTLSPSAAESLAEFDGVLTLNGLESLTADTARGLSQSRSYQLQLNGLSEISDDVARQLAQYKGESLWLNGVASLSPAAAKMLAGIQGVWTDTKTGKQSSTFCDLFLDGITSLTADAAQAFAIHTGSISLNGVTSLTPDVARGLATHRGRIRLNGLASLTPDVAAALVEQDEGYIELSGIKSLTLDVALALGEGLRDVHFYGLTTVDADVAAALSRNAKKGDHIHLHGLATLSPEAHAVLLASWITLPDAIKAVRPHTLQGSLVGLIRIRFGDSEDEVRKSSLVPLVACEVTNSEFVGPDVASLRSEAYPLAATLRAPVEFVFREDKLVGICLDNGVTKAADAAAGLMKQVEDMYGKLVSAGSVEDRNQAVADWSAGKRHEPIVLRSGDRRVSVIFYWEPTVNATKMQVVFSEDKEEDLPADERLKRIRERGGLPLPR